MNGRDRVSGGFFLVAGVIVAREGWRLGTGSMSAPGPGFVPFWSATVLAVLAAVVLGTSVLGPAGGERAERAPRQGRAAICLATLFLYVPAMLYLGFLSSTFVLMLVLFGLGQRTPWPVRIVASLVTTLAFYGLFARLLLVQFPSGLLGF